MGQSIANSTGIKYSNSVSELGIVSGLFGYQLSMRIAFYYKGQSIANTTGIKYPNLIFELGIASHLFGYRLSIRIGSGLFG